jgi:hypothetical protein
MLPDFTITIVDISPVVRLGSHCVVQYRVDNLGHGFDDPGNQVQVNLVHGCPYDASPPVALCTQVLTPADIGVVQQVTCAVPATMPLDCPICEITAIVDAQDDWEERDESNNGDYALVRLVDDLIIDNRDAATAAFGPWRGWRPGSQWGFDSLTSRSKSCNFRWFPDLPVEGLWKVSMWFPSSSSLAKGAAVRVGHAQGIASLDVNQYRRGGQWLCLGTFPFEAGRGTGCNPLGSFVEIAAYKGGTACADAVRFCYEGPWDAHPPRIISPAFATAYVGVPFAHDIRATGSNPITCAICPDTPPPAWLSLDCCELTGLPPVADLGKTIELTLVATNPVGTGQQAFSLLVWLADLIIDNRDPNTAQTGTWSVTKNKLPYAADSVQSLVPGSDFRWLPTFVAEGDYEVFAWWTTASSNYHSAQYTINHNGGSTVVLKDQRVNGGRWISLGTYHFLAGSTHSVVLLDTTGNVKRRRVVADAVMFRLVSPGP